MKAPRESTAAFEIQVSGTTVTQAEPLGLTSFSVEDHLDLIGMCEMTFVGPRDQQDSKEYLDWANVWINDKVEVSIGEGDPEFVGHIVNLRHRFGSGQDLLTITAMDPLHKLAALRQHRSFTELKDSAIATTILGELGLMGTVDATNATRPYFLWRGESGLALLRRLAARNGYVVAARDGKIDFKKPAQSQSVDLEIAKGSLIKLDYNFGPQNIPDSVIVRGWDPGTKEAVEGVFAGSSVAPMADGEDATTITWADPPQIGDVWVTTDSEAKHMAEVQMNHLANQLLRGRATLEANGSVQVGNLVRFTKHPRGFGPTAQVVSVRHRLAGSNGVFTTEIQFSGNVYPPRD